jgi:hypothetical protein
MSRPFGTIFAREIDPTTRDGRPRDQIARELLDHQIRLSVSRWRQLRQVDRTGRYWVDLATGVLLHEVGNVFMEGGGFVNADGVEAFVVEQHRGSPARIRYFGRTSPREPWHVDELEQ